MFTFTAVHVQYMVCECLHLQQFMYSTWYVNVYIYSSSQGAGRIAGVVIVNIYIYSSSCTVHGMLIFTFTAVHMELVELLEWSLLIFTFTAVHVQYMAC